MNDNLFGKKECPFKVPDHYFESFKVELPQKPVLKPEIHQKRVSLLSAFKPWVAMAAGFFLIALIYAQIPHWFSTNKPASTLSVENDDSLLNIMALIIDEESIADWWSEEENSTLDITSDTIQTITEDELALLTLFE